MNLSIKVKIIATSALAVALSLAISMVAGNRTNANLKIYQYISDVNFPNIQSLSSMEKAGLLIESASNMLIGSNTTAR